MSRKRGSKDQGADANASAEFQTFRSGLTKILKTPKDKIDAREVEWKAAHPKRKT